MTAELFHLAYHAGAATRTLYTAEIGLGEDPDATMIGDWDSIACDHDLSCLGVSKDDEKACENCGIAWHAGFWAWSITLPSLTRS